MAGAPPNSIQLIQCCSLDRSDLSANDTSAYPNKYENFQKNIENAFFKSELLLKCKIEFERLIKIEIPEPKQDPEISADDISLNLIFTGSIKSGRSSVINMILNAKVMPINVLGSSCCVKICHPKSSSKQISVGTYDWEGWEMDKVTDIEIEELPKRIEDMQNKLLRSSFVKGRRLSRRLHVQLPHWFLKNINIYKCSPIDGMNSFDEPFDIIEKSKNSVLVHVIDASNGLMEWDRTFLAKIQYKMPQLPIFFIINHVDIQYDILVRDRCIKFGSIPDKRGILSEKSSVMESESDKTSTDDGNPEFFNEDNLQKQQLKLIEKSKKQISKLGFALEKGLSIFYAELSVKEFFKQLKNFEITKTNSYHWDLADNFFKKLNQFLNAWMEKMLITSSLQLKCQINGVVDAILCHIIYPSALSHDVTSDIYMQNIKKAEKTISDSFVDVITDLEKLTLKTVKEQLKKKEKEIFENLPNLSTEDPNEIVHIIKPNLIKNCEDILIRSQSFNLNDEIHKIILKEIEQLEAAFDKICKGRKVINFTKYIFNLFRVLKITSHYPLIITLPEEIFYGNTKWYKDILRLATRRIRGTPTKPRELVQEMINDMTVLPLIKTTTLGLENIQKDIQFFTRKYQETYKSARNWSIESADVFKKLVMVDFIIQVIEKSFQKSDPSSRFINLKKCDSFYSEFYRSKEEDRYIHKKINIQSFTSLINVVSSLCFKRIVRSSQNILSYKSIHLIENGMCLVSYSNMECDLYTAVVNKTEWSQSQIYKIITQLILAIKCLQPYWKYIQIDLLPENILLEKDKSGHYNCYLFPHTEISTSLNYNIRADFNRKYPNILSAAVFQLGMVLSWLLTNDIHVCSEFYDQALTDDIERNISEHIKKNTSIKLKQFNLEKLCSMFLFQANEYESIETILKDINKAFSELDKVKEINETKSLIIL